MVSLPNHRICPIGATGNRGAPGKACPATRTKHAQHVYCLTPNIFMNNATAILVVNISGANNMYFINIILVLSAFNGGECQVCCGLYQ